jgi:hypothetical protein
VDHDASTTTAEKGTVHAAGGEFRCRPARGGGRLPDPLSPSATAVAQVGQFAVDTPVPQPGLSRAISSISAHTVGTVALERPQPGRYPVYEDHEHVYDRLRVKPGVVLIRGGGIVASRVLQPCCSG